MKLGGLLGCALGLAVAWGVVRPAAAQVSAYGEFSASDLTNLVQTKFLYGGTFGIDADLGVKGKLHFGADLRGQFLGGGYNLKQLSFGPRVSGHVKGFDPYGEFLVGFGRLNYPLPPAGSSSDGQLQFVAGLDRKLNAHFDVRVVEFTYEQYYGIGGQFNPKTFSSGVVYHFPSK